MKLYPAMHTHVRASERTCERTRAHALTFTFRAIKCKLSARHARFRLSFLFFLGVGSTDKSCCNSCKSQSHVEKWYKFFFRNQQQQKKTSTTTTKFDRENRNLQTKSFFFELPALPIFSIRVKIHRHTLAFVMRFQNGFTDSQFTPCCDHG